MASLPSEQASAGDLNYDHADGYNSLALSNVLDLLAALEEAARRSNWKIAAELAARLDHLKVPADPEELGRYLGRLRQTLIVARSSRAHAVASLRRVNAAAGFCRSRMSDAGERQNFVDSAEV